MAATVLLSRDVGVLILLARFRALAFGQLQELLCGTDQALTPRSAERVTYRVLGRLRRRGLLTSSADLALSLSRPTHRVYLLTPRGRLHYHLLDPRFPLRRIGTPSEAFERDASAQVDPRPPHSSLDRARSKYRRLRSAAVRVFAGAGADLGRPVGHVPDHSTTADYKWLSVREIASLP